MFKILKRVATVALALVFVNFISIYFVLCVLQAPAWARTKGNVALGSQANFQEMPPAKYFDASQKKLAEKMSNNIYDYVYFVNPGSEGKALVSDSALQIKPWKPAEKASVERVIKRVLQRTPSLLWMAGRHEKLPLCRITQARSLPHATACVGGGVTFFCDLFFCSSSQFLITTHELIHVADSGNAISFSPAFIHFAGSRLSEANEEIFDGIAEPACAAWHQNLPEAYSCTNIEDCLAECGAYYLCNIRRWKAPAEFVTKIAPRLLRPTANDIAFRQIYNLGVRQLGAGEGDSGLKLFAQASALNPTAAMPLARQAWLLAHRGDDVGALKLSNQADKLIQTVHRPFPHEELDRILGANGTDMIRSGRYNEALENADKFLVQHPGNIDGLALRSGCLEKLDRYFDAAVAYDQATKTRSTARPASPQVPIDNRLKSGQASDPEELARLDAQVRKHRLEIEPLLSRARFCKLKALGTTDLYLRESYSAKAYDDYQAAVLVEPDVSRRVSICEENTDLMIRLDKNEMAITSCCDLILQYPGEKSLLMRICKIRALCALGSLEQAKDEFASVKQICDRRNHFAQLRTIDRPATLTAIVQDPSLILDGARP